MKGYVLVPCRGADRATIMFYTIPEMNWFAQSFATEQNAFRVGVYQDPYLAVVVDKKLRKKVWEIGSNGEVKLHLKEE